MTPFRKLQLNITDILLLFILKRVLCHIPTGNVIHTIIRVLVKCYQQILRIFIYVSSYSFQVNFPDNISMLAVNTLWKIKLNKHICFTHSFPIYISAFFI